MSVAGAKFWTVRCSNGMDDGRHGAELSNSGTAKVSGCVERGSWDKNAAARLESAKEWSRHEVRGANDNSCVGMVGAAVRNGCKRALIGELTAGRLERRQAISASSSAILASAGL